MKNLAVTVTRLNSLIKRDFVKKKGAWLLTPKVNMYADFFDKQHKLIIQIYFII